jgi:outer membrane receptor for ferrienterochelin and colicins
MPASSSSSERRGRPARWRAAARLAGLLVAGALGLGPPPARAQEAHAPGPPASAAARLAFTLATLDGSRFVATTAHPGPVLINVWGVDCPPCVAELPLLLGFAQRHAGWQVLLVGTDTPKVAAAFLARHALPARTPANALWLRGATSATALMRAAGHAGGGLPLTVALRDGRVCARHAGLLDEAALAALAASATTGCAPR